MSHALHVSAVGIKTTLEFSDIQRAKLQHARKERYKIGVPTILVVEDQDFSRNLLTGLLRPAHLCDAAANAAQAIELYAENAPCITFLDIELPDADGHALAAFFKKYDPEGYIVMVTGNNYAKDVAMAKANRVQGFIAKPYNKQKIMGVVDAFIAKRKASK